MAQPFAIDQILEVDYRKNAVIVYNRLEASPRTLDFDRSLKSEIRDPLWMLSRQWQFGEFQGEDAATVFTARIEGEHTVMDRMQFAGGNSFPLNDESPLETVVEREKIGPGLFIASQMGRYFLKLMKQEGLFNATDLQKFLDKYPLSYKPGSNDRRGIELLNSVKGKIFDGFVLFGDMLTPEGSGTKFDAWLVQQSLPVNQYKVIAERFRQWHQRNYSQQTKEGAWLPSQLEYQFNISSPLDAGQQRTLEATQYYEGKVDWYSFDLNLQKRIAMDPEPAIEENKEFISSFIPTPISFKGMPKPRFWMMEESQTDFGKIDTTPTGLLHLLLAEFGLIYSNDWFMLPYPLRMNTLCEIRNIIVTDVFGQHILVRPAGRGTESAWQRWAMFRHSDVNNSLSNSNYFYLTPSIFKSMEGDALEQVNFLRDEMANLVWAVENVVPSQAGLGVNGDEMAAKEPDNTPELAPLAPIRYVLGTTVPDNWIPFMPVQTENSQSEIRLQRARMPESKGALGVLLSEKLPPYYINEEEILRSGVIVKRAFNRTRWMNGKTFLWIGRSKQTGRGEGWSNLKFDQIG